MVSAFDNILTILGEENQTIPLIFDSPHSGNLYPKDFNHNTTFEKLRQAEDSYVDELYDEASEIGAILLDENFNEKERFTARCRMPQDRVPSATALCLSLIHI